ADEGLAWPHRCHRECDGGGREPRGRPRRARGTRWLLPHVRGGKIKAYAVTSKERLASAPDIPTVDEAGLPDFHISVWHGLWVPKGTPKDVIAKLNAAAVASLADPIIGQRLAGLGQEIPALDQQT